MDKHTYFTVADVAERFKLYHRDGTLNTKAVYALPVRKTKLPGVGVRYTEHDLKEYEQLARTRGLLRGVA